MKRKVLIMSFAALAAASAAIYFAIVNKQQDRVCFQNNCFSVEIAQTPEQRSRGLMFRKNIGEKEGMLFIFDEPGNYPFWMKNTLVPLDIIWIDENKKVVFVSENTEPCKENAVCQPINPGENAKYVLEVKGGVVKNIGLESGELMLF